MTQFLALTEVRHDKSEQPIHVRRDAVQSVGTHWDGADMMTIVHVLGDCHFVRESPAEVLRLIDPVEGRA